MHKPRILVAPLDWGLGHATRSIAVIQELLLLGAEVVIAADGNIEKLLKKEFPSIVFLRLPGYRIRYSKNPLFLKLSLFLQSPRILLNILHEHRWLKKQVKQNRIDAIITDNRFGLFNKNIPSIFITHQLFIETGNSLMNRLAQHINYRFINRFSACWVPDAAGQMTIAGKLSHPKTMPAVPVHYLGLLSRFQFASTARERDLLVLISGPEPQRSIFEKIICEKLQGYSGKATVVRGKPGSVDALPLVSENIHYINHLPAPELSHLILSSDMVIARCGYSTVMDLMALKKKAILVPTPGQTEQEYISSHLETMGFFTNISQEDFNHANLDALLAKAGEKKNTVDIHFNKNVVEDWYNSLVKVSP